MLGKQSEDSRPDSALAQVAAVGGNFTLEAFFGIKMFRFIQMGQSDFLKTTEPSRLTSLAASTSHSS